MVKGRRLDSVPEEGRLREPGGLLQPLSRGVRGGLRRREGRVLAGSRDHEDAHQAGQKGRYIFKKFSNLVMFQDVGEAGDARRGVGRERQPGGGGLLRRLFNRDRFFQGGVKLEDQN